MRFLLRGNKSALRPSSPTSEKGNQAPTFSPPSFYHRRGHLVLHEDGPGDDDDDDDDESTTALVNSDLPPPPPTLKVKRVDYFYSSWSKAWKYRNTASKVKADALQTVGNGDGSGNDPWQSYCFVVVRKLPQPVDGEQCEPTFQVVVKSPYLLVACKDVIQKVQGISWTAEPLEVSRSTSRVSGLTLTYPLFAARSPLASRVPSEVREVPQGPRGEAPSPD